VLLDPTDFSTELVTPVGRAQAVATASTFRSPPSGAAPTACGRAPRWWRRVYRRKPAYRSWRDDGFAAYLSAGFVRRRTAEWELRCDPAWEARIFADHPRTGCGVTSPGCAVQPWCSTACRSATFRRARQSVCPGRAARPTQGLARRQPFWSMELPDEVRTRSPICRVAGRGP